MSATDKPDPNAGALFLAKLLAEDEAKRIEGLSDDEFLAEQRQKGRDPARTPSTEALLERVKAKAARQASVAPELAAPLAKGVGAVKAVAPVVPIRRPLRVLWLIAAALVVAVVAAALRGPEIVAHPRPGKADELRDDAIERCAHAAWDSCREKLDEAAKMDPEGESEPRVQKARTDIQNAEHPPPNGSSKP